MQVEKIILGIDPGTAIMGFGIISIKKSKIELVSIHELIPNTNRQYKRELECEVHNTLMLLKSWRKRYSKRRFYIQLSQVIYNDQRPTTKHWRNRLFSKLIREYRN